MAGKTLGFHSHWTTWGGAFGLALALTTQAPTAARAFCGFYVSGGGAPLFNNATQVVLMREGVKTILSMQNNYQGPPSDFAMVVPVPVVLKQTNVKTLPAGLFAKIDTLSAPRLVEYWEQDPCASLGEEDAAGPVRGPAFSPAPASGASQGGSVKVEAQFTVGEYDVVILSATEATALESWLTEHAYKIPTGAAPLFSQYIHQGQYFFVAKVDPKKVTFKDGQAVLSPLRFDYETQDFALPVRMGMVNSSGEQDLIVYILSREGRFEVANFPNVPIPTNIEVSQDVRSDFPTFFTKLFDRTVELNRNAVVTEYAWNASSCDPCPGPTMDAQDYATLGADTLSSSSGIYGNWTLTRLHARYTKDSLTDDLVFRKAGAITGGREVYGSNKQVETGAVSSPGDFNNFQGRYIMRHPWKGVIRCANPRRGIWGGPPDGRDPQQTQTSLSPNSRGGTTSAARSPLADRDLPSLIKQDIPEVQVKAKPASGCSMAGGGGGAAGLLGLFGLAGVVRRLRRRRRG